jgi:hypothetical protein
MHAAGVIVIVAVAVLIVGIALVVSGCAARGRRAAVLREWFGEEYERVVGERGRRRGEAELRHRLRRRGELSIRRLSAVERERYAAEWDDAERSFLNSPATGLRTADLLLTQVMRDRGYPIEGFPERAALVSVDHPDVVAHFRAGHAVAVANENSEVGTEEIRRAMLDYRFLFEELLDGGESIARRTGAQPDGGESIVRRARAQPRRHGCGSPGPSQPTGDPPGAHGTPEPPRAEALQ